MSNYCIHYLRYLDKETGCEREVKLEELLWNTRPLPGIYFTCPQLKLHDYESDKLNYALKQRLKNISYNNRISIDTGANYIMWALNGAFEKGWIKEGMKILEHYLYIECISASCSEPI